MKNNWNLTDNDAYRKGDWATCPHQYEKPLMIIEEHTIYSDWLEWCCDEMLLLKKEHENDLFRHNAIIISGGQYMDCDVSYRSKIIDITEELLTTMPSDLTYKLGDELKVIYFTFYTPIRIRNEQYTKDSFTMNEHAWDEMADLL